MATLRGDMGRGMMQVYFHDPVKHPVDIHEIVGNITPEFAKTQYVNNGKHASKWDRRDNAEMVQSAKKYKAVL